MSIINNDPCYGEILISDDNSPSVNEIKTLESRLVNHRNIKFFYNKVNLGWSDNRNKLVKLAKSDYVFLLGDDDLLSKNFGSKIHSIIKENPNIKILCGGYEIIDINSNSYYKRSITKDRITNIHNLLGREIFLFSRITMWIMHPFSILFKRELLKEFKYNKEVDIADDVLLLQELMLNDLDVYISSQIFISWRRNINKNLKTYSGLSQHKNSIIQSKLLVYKYLNQTYKNNTNFKKHKKYLSTVFISNSGNSQKHGMIKKKITNFVVRFKLLPVDTFKQTINEIFCRIMYNLKQ